MEAVYISTSRLMWLQTVFVQQIGIETAKHFLGWNSKTFQHILKKMACMMELLVNC